MTKIAVSWSRIETYEQCPLKAYWLNFAPKNIRVKQPPSPVLERGKKYHKWMENAVLGKQELPKEVAAFKKIVDLVKASPDKLFVEHQLAMTEKYQPCDWFSYNTFWRTIYDVLLVNKNSTSLDWKTGKVKDKGTDQLKFSAAAAFLRWPTIETISTHYIWLDHPTAPPTSAKFSRKQLPAIMDDFEERVDMIKISVEENTWEAKPSPLCDWCPCTKAHCKHATK